jgi:hypothetical protein
MNHTQKDDRLMRGDMKKIIEYLKGKKTYLVAIAGGIYAALIGAGVVQSYDFIWGLLGSGHLRFCARA